MKIPAGTTYYIEPPAKLIPKQISDAIGTALGKIPEIVEAHLPMSALHSVAILSWIFCPANLTDSLTQDLLKPTCLKKLANKGPNLTL